MKNIIYDLLKILCKRYTESKEVTSGASNTTVYHTCQNHSKISAHNIINKYI